MPLPQLTTLARLTEEFSQGEGLHDTPIAGVRCLKFSSLGAAMPTVYQPSVCFVVQGAKEVILQDVVYRYSPPQFLAVSVDLPVIGRVTEATHKRPYLCLQFDIDSRQLSELLTEMDGIAPQAADAERGVFVGLADVELLDCVGRIAGLLTTQKDIPMLAPMAIRELYYRLLRSEHGQRIAQIGIAGSSTQRIARVLRMLRDNYARAVRVEELASLAAMSTSSFHHHFKQVTTMSPLQYQKRLRLMEARRILLSEEADASSAAYRVGYESPSQFSREYSRMFGAPPRRDVDLLRHGSGV